MGLEPTTFCARPASTREPAVHLCAAYCRRGNQATSGLTPEVAGSGPVAPAQKPLQIGAFCCLARRRRSLVCAPSRAHPA